MALPFLPEDNIQPMFEQLRLEATTDPLKQFVNKKPLRNLDQQQHLASLVLERLHDGHQEQ